LSAVSASRFSQERDPEIDNYSISASEPPSISSNKGLYGTGLKNEVGEYNCFLNVIIQVSMIEFFSIETMIISSAYCCTQTVLFPVKKSSHFGI